MRKVRWFLFGAIIILALMASYGLALAGEPQSEWLWCDVIGAC